VTYRKDYREIESDAFWTLPRIAMFFVVTSFVFGIASLVVLPGAVVQKTLNADNVIQNYEWFHDINNRVMARTAQIKSHRVLVASATDTSEKNRLNIELSAMQQNCRDMVAQYNSNATKTNRSIFMGKTAPADLNPGVCE
jgi:hypothetical protein